jgi:hypothetical protein
MDIHTEVPRVKYEVLSDQRLRELTRRRDIFPPAGTMYDC